MNINKSLFLNLFTSVLIIGDLICWFSFKQVIYVLARMLIFHSTFTWKHWIGLVVTSVVYLIPYQQLAKMATPSYAEDGELLDGGFDMTTGGVCGYGFASSCSYVFFSQFGQTSP